MVWTDERRTLERKAAAAHRRMRIMCERHPKPAERPLCLHCQEDYGIMRDRLGIGWQAEW